MENKRVFDQFFEDVKLLEKRDSILNSKEQLQRLNRPGCKYFNLNPYDVLLLDPEATESEIKKKFRQFSILVHPDKNLDKVNDANLAFEAVKSAYNTLTSPEGKKKCEEIYDEAKIMVQKLIDDKRTKLRKQNAKTLDIEEDDPLEYKRAVHIQMCKLFADLERLRVEEEKKKQNEKKRKHEADEEEKLKREAEREYKKNYEATTENRVSSWRDFVKKPKTVKKFKPAKTKMEKRTETKAKNK